MRRWEDTIKVGHMEAGWKGVDSIKVADSERQQAFVITFMNLWDTKCMEFRELLKNRSFLRKSPLSVIICVFIYLLTFLQNVQTSSRTHPASIQWAPLLFSGHRATAPPSSVEVNKKRRYTFTCMAWTGMTVN